MSAPTTEEILAWLDNYTEATRKSADMGSLGSEMTLRKLTLIRARVEAHEPMREALELAEEVARTLSAIEAGNVLAEGKTIEWAKGIGRELRAALALTREPGR